MGTMGKKTVGDPWSKLSRRSFLKGAMWHYAARVSVLILVLLAGCTQAGIPTAPSVEKPAEKAAAQPADRPAERSPERAVEKPAEKAEVKPATSLGKQGSQPGVEKSQQKSVAFEVSFPKSARVQPINGRMLVILGTDDKKEPRLGLSRSGPPVFGVDVEDLLPEQPVVFDESVAGWPVKSLRDIPEGDYYVQAFINVYTTFHRADGHVVKLHMDQWEGQNPFRSPGNLYSEVQKLHVGPKSGTLKLSVDKVIPPIPPIPDTDWVKRIKIESPLLSKFWGQPIYIGATILLPKGYNDNPNTRYPVVYEQGHFSMAAPGGFTETNDFGKQWMSDDFPRVLMVTFQHPTPYFDDSYAVNSPSQGPYQDAIMTELIPYIESHFQVISKPSARALTGGSTGGKTALILQIWQPDFFGGVWSFYPDSVDLRDWKTVNIYEDDNFYHKKVGKWLTVPFPSTRDTAGHIDSTLEQQNLFELVLGAKGRSSLQMDAHVAVMSSLGEDGYPKPIWDKATGKIDHTVTDYLKKHSDIRAYLEANWPTVGPRLVGKLHIYVGDMDTHYSNNAVHLLDEFLAKTKDPHYAGTFEYGPRGTHGWKPEHLNTPGKLLREMAKAMGW